jgi:hypothetical protein
MAKIIERPEALNPSLSLELFGNEKSVLIINAAYDEAFKGYSELINDGWGEENALRSAYQTLMGAFESKIHTLAGGKSNG